MYGKKKINFQSLIDKNNTNVSSTDQNRVKISEIHNIIIKLIFSAC